MPPSRAERHHPQCSTSSSGCSMFRLGQEHHPLLGAPTVKREHNRRLACARTSWPTGAPPGSTSAPCPGSGRPAVVAALESVADEVRAADPAVIVEIVTDQDVRRPSRPQPTRRWSRGSRRCPRKRVTGGRDPGPGGLPLFSDGSILQPPTGIPTILFGPGDESVAHQVDEYVGHRPRS